MKGELEGVVRAERRDAVVDGVRVHSYFDPPADPGLDCSGDPGMTKQEFAGESDINRIMAKYEGNLALAGSYPAMFFGDFSEELDFHEAQNRVLQAEKAFMSLPARLRERFANQPGNLVQFLQDPANHEEAVKLGLVQPREPQEPRKPAAEGEASSKKKKAPPAPSSGAGAGGGATPKVDDSGGNEA